MYFYRQENAQTVVNLTATNGAVIDLYAKWIPDQHMLTFNANGGTVSPTSMVVTNGIEHTLPTPTRASTSYTLSGSTCKATGYTFAGWFTEASGGTQITADTILSQDMTVFAHWQETRVTKSPSISCN